MNAEEYMRSKLDGWFFRMATTSGPESRHFVRAIKVPKDYMPSHRPSWDYAVEVTEGPHHNALKFSEEQDETIIRMRAEGQRWADVAKAIKRCVNNTRDRYKVLCAERGMTPAPRRIGCPTKISDQVKAQMYAMRVSGGMTYEEIARQLGLSKWQVADQVAKMKRRMQGRAA